MQPFYILDEALGLVFHKGNDWQYNVSKGQERNVLADKSPWITLKPMSEQFLFA